MSIVKFRCQYCDEAMKSGDEAYEADGCYYCSKECFEETYGLRCVDLPFAEEFTEDDNYDERLEEWLSTR